MTFKSDVRPSLRPLHIWGIVHLHRTSHTANSHFNGAIQKPNCNREEHVFAWITDIQHMEVAVSHLEKFGFKQQQPQKKEENDNDGSIAFLPYSSKQNWINRYPQAAPVLECTRDGRMIVHRLSFGTQASSSQPAEDGTPSNEPEDTTEQKRRSVRMVTYSTFDFKGDIRPSLRAIHTSGILHAIRTKSTVLDTTIDIQKPKCDREEHVFAWIADTKHVGMAASHFENFGFIDDAVKSNSLFFLPYSSKRNWVDRYPHARPALECTREGEVVVLSRSDASLGAPGAEDERMVMDASALTEETDNNNNDNNSSNQKRKRPRVRENMLKDATYLPDAERDELHIEIYKYLKWLHDKLEKIEKKAAEAAAAKWAKREAEREEEEEDMEASNTPTRRRRRRPGSGRPKMVNIQELSCALEKLQSAFLVIPQECIDEGKGNEEQQQQENEDENNQITMEQSPPKKKRGRKSNAEKIALKNDTPFLEEALGSSLYELVQARGTEDGEPIRRVRRKKVVDTSAIEEKRKEQLNSWDVMFDRLVAYKEEFGDCRVGRGYMKVDVKLYYWVRNMRERRGKLAKQNLEYEEPPPEGKPLLPRTLTAERIEKLESIGFLWSVAEPKEKVSWEERFQEVVEYYNENGRWPSQSMGGLGMWVHKQRRMYSKKEKTFMLKKAPRLDEIGFEWTPRGNTKISWDEGFDMLMEFGAINGHYDVPLPSAPETNGDDEDEDEDDKTPYYKSDAYRLYKWVQSLHDMYRSYKLGRQSGSLNNERILMLLKHGFVFRNMEV